MKIHLTEYFDETVRKKFDDTAVIDRGQSITFGELSGRAKKLSRLISGSVNDAVNHPIAVFMEKSINSVTSDIGILYSGNAYMNLDIKTPEQRISGIIELVDPAAFITTSQMRSKLPENVGNRPVVLIDELAWDEIDFDDSAIYDKLALLIDSDPSCIINTSGSTGVPKGVILNHRSFFDFTEWAIDTLKIGDDEIIGSLSPIVFDIYSFELCMLMSKGSTIVVIPDEFAAFPVKIMQLMNETNVSFIFWVPTIMVNIANMKLLEKIPPKSLRTVWFAGEVFPTKQLNIWRSNLPEVKFVNLYGPIEITLDCTYYIIDRELRDDEPVPIGHSCRNTEIILLDENNLRVTEPGAEGELCVRGVSLAMGYYNNHEKTSAAFVQNPLNDKYPELIYRTGDVACYNEYGEIMFKGRRDTLIKHSGYRIELAEIEHIIVNTLKLTKNGCIVYDFANKEIVLYYEAKEEMPVSEWRRSIGTALPKYMIPTRYILMDELPRNTNGKVDRLKLKNSL